MTGAPTGHASQVWTCASHTFDLTSPKILGILNLTPDSFSGDGVIGDTKQAIERGVELFKEGADIIDVGGESTRPGSSPVSDDEQAARIIDVIEGLSRRDISVSVDTRSASVASAALAAGACIINDVTGFTDPAMVEVAKRSDAGLIVMHMQGEPMTMQDAPHYEDVVEEVCAYLYDRARDLEHHGVDAARIAIDPGFGFGKTKDQNLGILENTARFAELGYPLVVAVSRKGTIGSITGAREPKDRVMGSVAAALFAIERGARIARVHDVRQTKEAFLMYEALITHGSENLT